MAVSIIDIVLRDILKISPTLISKYPSVQDQLFYLILIPHVLLIIFLVAFSRGFVARFVSGHHGLTYLVSIVLYIYLVYAGWYGSLLVTLFSQFLYLALFIGVVVFFLNFIWHPSRLSMTGKLLEEAGEMLASKTIGKEKIRKEIEKLKKQINSLNMQRASLPPGSHSRQYYDLQIAQLQAKQAELESQL